MLSLSQLQALRIIETINIRLNSFKKSIYEIMDAIDENEIQFCKARRQGLELIKEFDKYAALSRRIIKKYLNDVMNCKAIEELDFIVSRYNEYKIIFQN